MRKEWIKPVLKNSDVKSTERTITTFICSNNCGYKEQYNTLIPHPQWVRETCPRCGAAVIRREESYIS